MFNTFGSTGRYCNWYWDCIWSSNNRNCSKPYSDKRSNQMSFHWIRFGRGISFSRNSTCWYDPLRTIMLFLLTSSTNTWYSRMMISTNRSPFYCTWSITINGPNVYSSKIMLALYASLIPSIMLLTKVVAGIGLCHTNLFFASIAIVMVGYWTVLWSLITLLCLR